MLRLLRWQAAADEVRIEVPPRDFEIALVRVRRFLFWSWTRTVSRRLRVAALPLRELLVAQERLRRLGEEMDGLIPREALFVALRTTDALQLTDARAKEIWEAWQRANRLSYDALDNALTPKSSRASVLDIVMRLERWPFNFAEDRVLAMTASEALARLAEWTANGPVDLGRTDA
jgi:hypothetical protein